MSARTHIPKWNTRLCDAESLKQSSTITSYDLSPINVTGFTGQCATVHIHRNNTGCSCEEIILGYL